MKSPLSRSLSGGSQLLTLGLTGFQIPSGIHGSGGWTTQAAGTRVRKHCHQLGDLQAQLLRATEVPLLGFLFWWTESNLGVRGPLYLTTCSPSFGETRVGSQDGNGCRGRAGTLLKGVPPQPAILIELAGVTSSGETLPVLKSALPRQTIDQENAHRLVLRPVQWEHILNWGSLFKSDPDLCQMGIKLASAGRCCPWLSANSWALDVHVLGNS